MRSVIRRRQPEMADDDATVPGRSGTGDRILPVFEERACQT
jgi:hypothetical protein